MPHKCTSCARQFADGSKEMLSGCPDCGGTKFQFMPNGGAPAAEEPPSPPERGTGTVTETVGHVATKLRDFVGDDPGPPTRRASGGTDAASGGDAADAADAAEAAGAAADGTAGAASGSIEGEENHSTGTGTGGASAAAAATQMEHGSSHSERRSDDDVSTGSQDDDGPVDDEATQAPDPDDAVEEPPGPEDGAQSAARSQMVTADELPEGPAWPGTDDEDVQPATDPDAESEGRVVDTPSSDAPDLAQLREELNDQFEGIRITEPGQYELNLMELYEREETIIALQENGRYVIEPPESWRGDDE